MTDKRYLTLFTGLFSAHITTGFDCYGNKVTRLGYNTSDTPPTPNQKQVETNHISRLKII